MKKILFILFIGISFLGCYEPEPYVAPTPKVYYYEVTGSSGSYSVTIQNANNNTQQWSSVGNGWKYTWNQTGSRWLCILAQNNEGSGNVTVSIYKDGKMVATNTSYGGYTIATVDGTY